MLEGMKINFKGWIMKVLITGVAGFIGFNLANRLLKEGHSVCGIDNLNDYYDVNLKKIRLAIIEKNLEFKSNS